MDIRDVNRINYNNYNVGKNLDFLIRSKMRSESLTTPLKNTPSFYDDQVSAKLALLGKRGFEDPDNIYEPKNINVNFYQNQDQTPLNENTFSQNQNIDQKTLADQYEKELIAKQQEQNFDENKILREQYEREIARQEKFDEYMNNMRHTPQKMDNFELDKCENKLKQDNKFENNYQNNYQNNYENNYQNNYQSNNQNNYENNYQNNYQNNNQNNYENNNQNNYEKNYNYIKPKNDLYYNYNYGMVRNKDKIQNQDYEEIINEHNYFNELSKKNGNTFNLPLTRNEILQGVYEENFNRKNDINK